VFISVIGNPLKVDILLSRATDVYCKGQGESIQAKPTFSNRNSMVSKS
jgi:hypothetical protein